MTNEAVLHFARPDRKFMRMIRHRKLSFLGHVKRQKQLESMCVMSEVEDRRGRVRLRAKVVDTLVRAVDDCTTSAQQLQMTVRINDCMRSMVANVLGDTAPQYGEVNFREIIQKVARKMCKK